MAVESNRKTDHLRLLSWHRKSYASTNLKKGCSREQIRNALVKNSYGPQDIDEAFKGVK